MKRLWRIFKDERGVETLQAVMIVGVAAIILAVVTTQWPTIKQAFQTSVGTITNFK